MERIFLITVEEVLECENTPHTPLAYKNKEDAQRKFAEIKRGLEEEYRGKVERGWVKEGGDTWLSIYDEGYYVQSHVLAKLRQIDLQ